MKLPEDNNRIALSFLSVVILAYLFDTYLCMKASNSHNVYIFLHFPLVACSRSDEEVKSFREKFIHSMYTRNMHALDELKRESYKRGGIKLSNGRKCYKLSEYIQ